MMSKQNTRLFILVFLGMLSAFGPFVMDMYLPTLPAMSEYFHTTSSMVQLGLTTSMVGLAIGQLLFGPLSDKYGRRSPLFVAMFLFLFSTVGCIFSQNIIQFVVLRFIQGVAGAGGVVISRSIAADKYVAHELATMLAVIGAVNGVATVAAPIAGGILAEAAGWHGIFWFLFILGVLLLGGVVNLNESLPIEKRSKVGWQSFYRNFAIVLGNRKYVLYILQYGFTMGVLFVNISSAPFIMQEHYGLSPMMFSLCFGINAIAMIISSTAAVKLPSMEYALYVGSNGMVLIAACLLVCLSLDCNFWIYEVLIFVLLAMVGMSYTASNALAMDCERKYSGIASALLGATGFLFGGLVPPLVGIGDMMFTAGFLFLAGSVCAYLCTRYAVSYRGFEKNLLYHIANVIRLPYVLVNKWRG